MNTTIQRKTVHQMNDKPKPATREQIESAIRFLFAKDRSV
jgi:hypothetical protein